MSKPSWTIVAAAAVSLTLFSLTLGAAQFAFGRDLIGASHSTTGIAAPTTINRAAKADRPAGAMPPAAPTQTISFQPSDLPATSVLVRVPLAQAARGGSPLWMRSGDRKAIACEPSVSVLTEVARQLQPGRCVT
jgi:hypothetical protein